MEGNYMQQNLVYDALENYALLLFKEIASYLYSSRSRRESDCLPDGSNNLFE